MPNFSLLIVGSFVLGLRHGVDWDHIAAISDIVGANSADSRQTKLKALWLATSYSAGHGCVVVVLGIAAICFSSILPIWIDGVMGRVVGLTLIFLGVWVLATLFRSLSSGKPLKPQSRLQLVLSAFDLISKRLKMIPSKGGRGEDKGQMPSGVATAFGIGSIHGIGAETGSQVLLLVSAGSVGDHFINWGVAMLFSFVAGLLVSNTMLALSLIFGFTTARFRTPMFAAMSVLTGFFSIAVGAVFVLGHDAALPDLQKIIP